MEKDNGCVLVNKVTKGITGSADHVCIQESYVKAASPKEFQLWVFQHGGVLTETFCHGKSAIPMNYYSLSPSFFFFSRQGYTDLHAPILKQLEHTKNVSCEG